MGKYKMTEEEERELDPFDFENYCGACDGFPGSKSPMFECPFKEKFERGELNGHTEWKKIGCNKFWD